MVGLMVLVGGFDDMFPVRARYRFVAQLVAAVAVTFAGGVTVTQLGQCFAPFELGLGLLAVPFTMVCITGLINAYNMSDGLDGLCGGHALRSRWAGFALAALLANGRGGAAFTEVAPVVVPTVGAVIGFLAMNARGFWRAGCRSSSAMAAAWCSA
ncbi:MAG: hypothetical protein R3E83_11210 [Burkholderiaceae bacterium]